MSRPGSAWAKRIQAIAAATRARPAGHTRSIAGLNWIAPSAWRTAGDHGAAPGGILMVPAGTKPSPGIQLTANHAAQPARIAAAAGQGRYVTASAHSAMNRTVTA